MIIRPAQKGDAAGIAGVLHDLVNVGKRTKRDDAKFALEHYIAHPDKNECFVTQEAGGRILGFQFLKLAKNGNEYGAQAGWALIGTHICPTAARRGIGKALFASTFKAAQCSGAPAIEAFIRETNAEGQAYYEAMGFADYRRAEGAICKSLHLH
jgi:L-amino acid N-acyltransferase YncA